MAAVPSTGQMDATSPVVASASSSASASTSSQPGRPLPLSPSASLSSPSAATASALSEDADLDPDSDPVLQSLSHAQPLQSASDVADVDEPTDELATLPPAPPSLVQQGSSVSSGSGYGSRSEMAEEGEDEPEPLVCSEQGALRPGTEQWIQSGGSGTAVVVGGSPRVPRLDVHVSGSAAPASLIGPSASASVAPRPPPPTPPRPAGHTVHLSYASMSPPLGAAAPHPLPRPAAPVAVAAAVHPAAGVTASPVPAASGKRVQLTAFAQGLKERWSTFKLRKTKPLDPISVQAAAAAAAAGSGPVTVESPSYLAVPSVSAARPSAPSSAPASASVSPPTPSMPHSGNSSPLLLSQLPPNASLLAGAAAGDEYAKMALFAATMHISEPPPSLSQLHAADALPSPPPLSIAAAAASAAATGIATAAPDPRTIKALRAEAERAAKERAALDKARAKEAERAAKDARRDAQRAEKERLKQAARDADQEKKQAKLLAQSMKSMLERAALTTRSNTGRTMDHAGGTTDVQGACISGDFFTAADRQPNQSPPSMAYKPSETIGLDQFGSAGVGVGAGAGVGAHHVVHHDSRSPPPCDALDAHLGGSALDFAALEGARANSPVIGQLHLHIVQGHQINGGKAEAEPAGASSSSSSSSLGLGGGSERWKQKTCVEVTYGGTTYRSEFRSGSAPHYDYFLSLPVYEITTDVLIQFVLKHSLKKNETFGMCVVPLSLVLNAKSLTAASASASTATMAGSTAAPPTPSSASSPTSTFASASTSQQQQQQQHDRDASSGGLSSSPHDSSPGDKARFAPAPSPLVQFRSLLSSLFLPSRTFHFRHWLHLYPSQYDKAGTLFLQRFPAALDGMLNSGMVRPKKELGFVLVDLQLRLEKSLAFDYCQVDPRQYYADSQLPPGAEATPANGAAASAAAGTNGSASSSSGVALVGAPSPSAPSVSSSSVLAPLLVRPEEPSEFHKTVFKKNVRRLKRWMEVPVWAHTLSHAFSFQLPIVSFYLLALWAHVCFTMPAWQFPLLILGTVFLLNAWIVAWKLRVEHQLIHSFQDDALPYEHANEGSWKRFKRYKGHLAKTSFTIGRISAVMEKTTNLLNFSDMSLSVFTYTVLLALVALLSGLLYLVPANVCVFLCGLQLFVRGAVRTVREWLERCHPEWCLWKAQMQSQPQQRSVNGSSGAPPLPAQVLLSMPGGSGSSIVSPVLNSVTAKAAMQAGCSGVVVARVDVGARARWAAWARSGVQAALRAVLLFGRAVRQLVVMLRHLYARSPDYYELAHRVLCERAIQDSLVARGMQSGSGGAGGKGMQMQAPMVSPSHAQMQMQMQSQALPSHPTPTSQARRLLFGSVVASSPTAASSQRGNAGVNPLTPNLVRRYSETAAPPPPPPAPGSLLDIITRVPSGSASRGASINSSNRDKSPSLGQQQPFLQPGPSSSLGVRRASLDPSSAAAPMGRPHILRATTSEGPRMQTPLLQQQQQTQTPGLGQQRQPAAVSAPTPVPAPAPAPASAPAGSDSSSSDDDSDSDDPTALRGTSTSTFARLASAVRLRSVSSSAAATAAASDAQPAPQWY